MLTLLAREAGFSAVNIRDFIQIAVAHYYSGGQQLEDIFNTVISNAKMLALLDTLAGYTHPEDEVLFMSLNGRFIGIDDIITDILSSPNPNGLLTLSQVQGTDPGLVRQTYESLNKWHSPEGELDSAAAEERSEEVYGAALSILYKTKIRISIKASQIFSIASTLT